MHSLPPFAVLSLLSVFSLSGLSQVIKQNITDLCLFVAQRSKGSSVQQPIQLKQDGVQLSQHPTMQKIRNPYVPRHWQKKKKNWFEVGRQGLSLNHVWWQDSRVLRRRGLYEYQAHKMTSHLHQCLTDWHTWMLKQIVRIYILHWTAKAARVTDLMWETFLLTDIFFSIKGIKKFYPLMFKFPLWAWLLKKKRIKEKNKEKYSKNAAFSPG